MVNPAVEVNTSRVQPQVSVNTHSVHRLTVDVPGTAGDFRRRYEEAVPAYPEQEILQMVNRRASWAEMIALVERIAPFGFMIYGTTLPDSIMELAGDKGSCVTYLMGNHTIAERMFRHEPLAMLHVPLRTAIWAYADGRTKFSLDRPSDLLASFGNPEIAEVGVELDRKVAALLEHLEVSVPDMLRSH